MFRNVVTGEVSIFGVPSCETLECMDTEQRKAMSKKSDEFKCS